jgi:hypothetical protein
LQANDWQKQACGCGDDRWLLSECKTKWRDELFSMDYQNVRKLVKYVALDDIYQLWGCYLATKIDPSVFVEPDQAAEMAANVAEAN